MAKIREGTGKRKTLVLAWSGTRYEFQESVLRRLSGSREAVEYIMTAIREHEAKQDQDVSTPKPSGKIAEQPQKQEILPGGVSLTGDQRADLKKRFTL